MRTPTLLSALILTAMAASSHAGIINVALGKPVTLVNPEEFGTGSGYFGGGTGGYTLPSPAIVTDGIFQAGYWATGIWWDEQHSGHHSYVVVDLLGTYQITGFAVMADENDRYLFEYRNSLGNWVQAWDVSEAFAGGLSYRSTVLGTPVQADALRLSAIYVPTTGHDYAYAVTEIQATAVPEPAQWVLLATGLLLGWRRCVSQVRPPRIRLAAGALRHLPFRAAGSIFLQKARIMSGTPSPSCGARRKAETAALLADEVFPDVPLRRWVISFPFPLTCSPPTPRQCARCWASFTGRSRPI